MSLSIPGVPKRGRSAAEVASAVASHRFPVLPKHHVGQRLTHEYGYGGVPGTIQIAANTLYATPICVAFPTTISSLDLEVTVVSAGNLQIGIGELDDDGGTWDMALRLDAGSVAVPAVANTLVSVPAAYVLQPGILYAFLLLGDSTPTVRSINSSTDLFGNLISTGPLVCRNALWVAQTFGPLPATKTFSTTASSCHLISGVVT